MCWKRLAAATASTLVLSRASAKSDQSPAPPQAITGISEVDEIVKRYRRRSGLVMAV